jgi:membrane protease YdiL (CAAX protease family)
LEVLVAVPVAWLAGGLAVLPLLPFVDPDPAGPIGGGGLLLGCVSNAVTIGLLVWWLRRTHPSWIRVIGWPVGSQALREVAIGAGLGLLVRIASGFVAVVVVAALRGMSDRDVALPVQIAPDLAWWGVLSFAVFALVAAPALEELVFRGLLFRSVADRHGFWPGAVASALAFGAFHLLTRGSGLSVAALGITHAFTGFGFVLVYTWRRNLLASIAAHAAFNAVAVVAIIAGWEV